MTLLVQAQVAQAARDTVAGWPIASFIATNPLAPYEATRFDHAAAPGTHLTLPVESYRAAFATGRITRDDLVLALRARGAELREVPPFTGALVHLSPEDVLIEDMLHTDTPAAPAAPPALTDPVADLVVPWLAAFLDPDPQWQLPERDRGFYAAWRALATHDPRMPRPARRKLRDAPEQPSAAIAACFTAWGTRDADRVTLLKAELAALPGWTGYLKWRSEHDGDIDLTEYLAVRLTVRLLLDLPPTADQPDPEAEAALTAPTPTPGAELLTRAARLADTLAPGASPADVATLARLLALHPLADHPFTWQAAYEGHYRRELFASLTPGTPAPAAPRTQVVLCIDPRSEGLRRHLETDAGIETFGLAGFFGVPVRFATYEGRGSIDSLPALLQPKHAVTEAPADADRASARTRGLRALDAASHSLHVTENATATPFALAEATGFLFGVSSVVRTLAPTLHHTLTRRWRDRIAPPVDSRVTIASAFTLEERATLAEAGLRMMGLGRFAPLVVLAGHGSVSTNNLYQAALDCGACGGNPGAVNARAAAEIFNDPDVREILAARGLEIPAGTHFVAALHDTVADRVMILDRHLIPDSHATLVDDFTTQADAAADGLVRERAVDLPGADPTDSLAKLRARAHDWAEVYPELGLAGNAAMIIGPREMTRGANLHRRVFLHSCDAALDPEGTGLETILTAPVVVAQWINHQYYFSTLNPETLGAGTKTIHNAIGGIGVLAGHSGDLQRGLPRQSVAVGDALLHEPLRLSVIVQAPIDRISAIVSGNQVLRDLFDNEWISLTARSTAADPWWTYTALGWATTETQTPTRTSTATLTRTETP
ncbi:DUF2309 domain-containing protein [Microbacterium sp. NPDC077184]|uniref:DUF2309 domain-containing protein n=1 Tax=Microbacterium sp. NPDC077184 TaxID=3154764 RepID=UPI00342D220B